MRNLARNDALTGEVVGLALALNDPETLNSWLRWYWRIVPDPPDAEFIRSPAYILRCGDIEGDCDDAATFAASILTAMGYPALLMAVRQSYETDFSHVFVRVPGLNLDIDPIVPAELIPIRYGEAMVLAV